MANGVEIDDPLSLNLYTYCGNETVMLVNPSGHRYTLGATADEDARMWRDADAKTKKSCIGALPKPLVINGVKDVM